MANAKRLSELIVGRGMKPEHLDVLTGEYFGGKCIRWFYFDLGKDLQVPSSGKEIDVKVKHIDNPAQVTIELGEEYTSNEDIKHGRLTSELIEQVEKELEPYKKNVDDIKGIALTIGQIGSEDKFLLLELYIKEGESGEIKFIRIPPPPIIGDNLTPTSIPPGRRKR